MTAPGSSERTIPLAESIQIATRVVHAKLNKLIVAKLPLALPPTASDPAPYITGILHIAPIYIAFESCWKEILDVEQFSTTQRLRGQLSPDSTMLDDLPPQYHSKVDERIQTLLRNLRLPGLMRSTRLRADIKSLTGWSERMVEGQIHAIGQTERLGEFVRHIRRVIERKPHVLLAYSYIMYMALFAGGRFIRAALESAGDEFWSQIVSPVQPLTKDCHSRENRHQKEHSQLDEDLEAESPLNPHAKHGMPLRFFHFQTPLDGEDLKQQFKKRLLLSESVLTPKERQEIIQEAICIFDNMTLVVQQLDVVCIPDPKIDLNNPGYTDHLAHSLKHSVGKRLRDSVAVTKERRAKSSLRWASENDSEPSSYSYSRGHQSQMSEPALSPVHRTIAAAPSLPSGHIHLPMVLGLDNVKLCPAMAKSMRFESSVLKPQRMPESEGHNESLSTGNARILGVLKIPSKPISKVHIANWVVAVAFGVIFLGAWITGGRRTLVSVV